MRRSSIAACLALALGLTCAASARAHGRHGSSPQTTGTHHKTRKHHARRGHAQAAPAPDRISEIQSALAHGGYYKSDPNGKWDSDTVAALQKFQSANGLDSTGKLDAPTLQKLGLGSDIAGVSAPKPIVPDCCSVPSGTLPSGNKSAPVCCSAPSGAAPTTPAQPAAPVGGAATTASNSAIPDSDPQSPQQH
ncbi:MAG TPA: peptidoglycan-binding domain-containing protein [Candidatus Aquilonibacter sp.]|nr:peptidoglycan-binding domain-containing protein [Candidatus Aquilonibacter sp.]